MIKKADVILIKRKPGQYNGQTQEGYVPPAPVEYQPMETAPGLFNITPTPIASNTKINLTPSVVFLGNTSPAQAIAWQDHVLHNVRISFIIRFEGDSTDTPSFVLAVRMTDNLNFIGLRSYAGLLQVWESVDGFITKLCECSNDGTIGHIITLSAVEDVVKIRVDGRQFAEGVTTVLTAGRAGCVPGFWSRGETIIGDGYQMSDAPENEGV